LREYALASEPCQDREAVCLGTTCATIGANLDDASDHRLTRWPREDASLDNQGRYPVLLGTA
jgi:hypothetical protein